VSKIDPFFNDLAAARSASSGLGGPVESSRDPALRVAYSSLRLDEPLGDDVLAAVVFGGQTPCPADPRCLRIDLEPLAGAGLSEVWRGTAPARIGTTGPIRHVDDGRCLAGWIELEERRFGGLVEASEAAYRGMLRFQAQSPFHHVWRIWNFITAINEGEGDAERYKHFCLGRARAFAATHATATDFGYPAASAVGKPQGQRTLQVCWLAGREPAERLENPRQVSAYDYPRRYGPAAPSFSRAMLTPDPLLLISGTASIVGHASVHAGDVRAQLEETLANLESLLQHTRTRNAMGSSRLGPASVVKVYLRNPGDTAAVESRLRERLGHDVPFLILAADICRSELLLEIEVVQRDGRTLSA
jgi:chorismate lyase/3-hydroxybenzoate synthase